MTKLRDLRAALADFKKSGKKVVAYSDAYMQAQYYLAAQADEVYLHPQGMVLLEGFGRWRNFYKEGLDRSASRCTSSASASTSRRSSPTSATTCRPRRRRCRCEFYGDLWRDYLADVAAARKIEPEDITALHRRHARAAARRRGRHGEDGPRREARGQARPAGRGAPAHDRARRARTRRRSRSGRSASQTYLAGEGRRPDRARPARGSAVAVVVAKGDILDGTQPAGTIGGDSTARLLRRAREDDSVKAVVLRVDSPGGSAFASEIIRRECELVRKAGQAARGLDGQRGRLGRLLDLDRPPTRSGPAPRRSRARSASSGSSPRSTSRSRSTSASTRTASAPRASATPCAPTGRMDPAVADVVQQGINHGYEEFLARVAQARKMTPRAGGQDRPRAGLERRGREGHRASWTSSAASTRRSSRRRSAPSSRRATASGTSRRRRPSARGSMSMLAAQALDVAAAGGLGPGALAFGLRPLGGGPPAGAPGRRRAALGRWNDPRGVYAHCLCGED